MSGWTAFSDGRRTMLMLFVCAAIYVSQGSFAICNAQNAEETFELVSSRLSNAESLRIEFEQRGQMGLSGILTVKRGNRYILELPGRTIYCNGSTVWNYDAANKKVIVSEYLDGADAISPEKLFLSFPTTYTPSLKKESNSNGTKYIALTLRPRRPQDAIGGMNRIVLKLTPGSLDIRMISISDGASERVWLIKNIAVEEEIADTAFEFEAGEGVRVIDLR